MEQALQIAINMEEEGKKTYLDVASSTKNPVVKAVFDWLANEEDKHIIAIKQISKVLDMGKLQDLLGQEPLKEAKIMFKKVIEPLKDSLQPDDTDVEAYKKALNFEKRGHDYYEEMSTKTEDQTLKDFYEFMTKQEKAHFELLQKSLEFVQHPIQWFENEEGWFL